MRRRLFSHYILTVCIWMRPDMLPLAERLQQRWERCFSDRVSVVSRRSAFEERAPARREIHVEEDFHPLTRKRSPAPPPARRRSAMGGTGIEPVAPAV